MQLDSLLRSVKDHCTGVSVNVIAKASNKLHIDAYTRLLTDSDHLFESMSVSGPDGGPHLGHELDVAITDAEYTALAVDDQLFYAPSDFKIAAETLDEHLGFVWSWRLGYDVDFTEACPCLVGGMEHWLTTSYVQSPDYSYLFHSDGAIYKTERYIQMLDRFLPDWRTGAYIPNDLEAAVAGQRPVWAATVGPHLGPPKPTCTTWQLNRVQRRYGSPAAELPETQTDILARAYLDGRRVDNKKLYAAMSRDAQQFNPPGARPTHVYASEAASKFWASAIR